MARREELEDEARRLGYADGFAGKTKFSSVEDGKENSPYYRKAYLEEYETGELERNRKAQETELTSMEGGERRRQA